MPTLKESLEALRALDELEELPNEDQLKTIIGDVAGKVDAIKWKTDMWYAQAQKIYDEWLTPLSKQRNSLMLKADCLYDYAKEQMLLNGFDQKGAAIPGEAFRLQMMESEAVDCPPASAELMLQYPKLVKQDVSYSWDKKLAKELLERGESIPLVRIIRKKYVQFFKAKKG